MATLSHPQVLPAGKNAGREMSRAVRESRTFAGGMTRDALAPRRHGFTAPATLLMEAPMAIAGLDRDQGPAGIFGVSYLQVACCGRQGARVW
ncbi:MAG TPA: hypothetical protein PK706_04525 [Xanthobacteraceae bacterium]|nr:hypothetical protein [Xanthobacteraceae bacterium]